jgi:hypothetical protein
MLCKPCRSGQSGDLPSPPPQEELTVPHPLPRWKGRGLTHFDRNPVIEACAVGGRTRGDRWGRGDREGKGDRGPQRRQRTLEGTEDRRRARGWRAVEGTECHKVDRGPEETEGRGETDRGQE